MSKGIESLKFFDKSQPESFEYQVAQEKLLKGNPLQAAHNYYSSDDELFSVGIWESGPGAWKISYTEHEFTQLLSGVSILRDAAGNEVTLKAGDSVTIPAGFEGEWEVVEDTRKIYVIYEPAA